MALQLPPSQRQKAIAVCNRYDFSAASAHLIPSTPGYHTGAAMHRQGHMAVRALLSREVLPSRFQAAPVLAQCSSLGSLTAPWLFQEFSASLSSGKAPDGPLMHSPGMISDYHDLLSPVKASPPPPPPFPNSQGVVKKVSGSSGPR